ncbi:hypothetical protein VNO77_19111 [Canavalia gladiata]|uniref:Uncharacterized protein n=1 Tax=Canavalia gladiata TaxID=3824 RepID=A0AAN9LLU9_CANGL
MGSEDGGCWKRTSSVVVGVREQGVASDLVRRGGSVQRRAQPETSGRAPERCVAMEVTGVGSEEHGQVGNRRLPSPEAMNGGCCHPRLRLCTQGRRAEPTADAGKRRFRRAYPNHVRSSCKTQFNFRLRPCIPERGTWLGGWCTYGQSPGRAFETQGSLFPFFSSIFAQK